MYHSRKMHSLVLHLGIVLYYVSAWVSLLPMIVEPSKDFPEDERLTKTREICDRCLTMWNFKLQTLVFVGYLVCDVLAITLKYPRLRRILEENLDKCFYSIIVPMSIFIPAIFWSLYLYDPAMVLIFPNLIGDVLSPWANHTMHTFVLLIAFLKVFHSRISPIKLGTGQNYLAFVIILHVFCLYITYYEKNFWPYPFLTYFHEPFRCILLALLGILFLTTNLIFYRLNELYCHTALKMKKEPVIRAEKSQ